MVHQAGAYPGFCSMKRLGVFLLPPGWDANPPKGYLQQIKFAGTHLSTWVERGTVRVKCLAQEHNATTPARARTRTARSEDERTTMRPPRLPHLGTLNLGEFFICNGRVHEGFWYKYDCRIYLFQNHSHPHPIPHQKSKGPRFTVIFIGENSNGDKFK